tara:strand:- start:1713 stop:2030 length:318 start_codon:yes stop_codon:yes gene_type:complete
MSIKPMNSVFQTFIRNELGFIIDEAKEAGVLVSKYDEVGNNDITMYIEKNYPALTVQIRKGSEQFNMQEFIQSLGYKVFRVRNTVAIYLNEANFFYATLGKGAIG